MDSEKENVTPLPQPSAIDFALTPFVAIWEITRACDLACRHCRAEAIRDALPGELTTREGLAVLEELAAMGTPICVLSGGDPAKRADLCDLVRQGQELGMRMATIPAATHRLTRELVQDLKDAGLSQMALSLDGPTAEIHDTFRGTPGAFELTLGGAAYANQVGLPFQINTTFSAYNWQHFDAMADLVRRLGVVFWEVFFLVPMGRGREVGQMNSEQFERLFERLAHFARSVNFIVKITEAPHYRRYLMQQRKSANGGNHQDNKPAGHPRTSLRDKGQLPAHMTRDFGPGGSIGLAPKGVNSGNGHLFISYCGDICPSGFLPLACGNVRRQSIADVYRSHPVFRELRTPELFKGKCGVCEFRNVCGGSRARAYAMTGDYLAEEPFCAYEPRRQGEQCCGASVGG
ncbi:MAG: TIGR04053 family radical SAM/SPASM domain-containing protein [Acidobacteria bacterium]|nr:TIGR04053 family radical SAM/SPASM domain-containing protein [Acidobacteriota bacterium]